MMAKCWRMAREVRLIGKTLLSAVLVCCLTDVACSQGKTGAPRYDVTLRPLDEVPAGTVIGKEPPRGWTHLIIKSHARPGAGDVKALSPIADRLSRFLVTVVLANVKAEKTDDGPRYRLARVAVGLGTTVAGKDTVLTPDSLRQLGVRLGWLERVVLSTAHDKLREVVVVARSHTMLVFDSPAMMVRHGQHRPVVLRYALLVDDRSGRLDTLLWVLDQDEDDNFSGLAGAVQWLPPSKIDDCVLHVDAHEFSLGTPTERAFAMAEAPKGEKEFSPGDDLKALAVRQRFSPATAADLEARLREALRRAAK